MRLLCAVLFLLFKQCSTTFSAYHYIDKHIAEQFDVLERRWENKFNEVRRDLSHATHEVQNKNEETVKLRILVEGLHSEIKEIRSLVHTDKLDKTKEISDHYQKRLLNLTGDDKIQQIQRELILLSNDIKSMKLQHRKIKGFTVLLGGNAGNLGANQLILYDFIISNRGNCYNPQTGIFTSDTKGLYLFFVHTLAMGGKHVETMIVKNGQEIAVTYAYDPNYYTSGSNLAIVPLDVGDRVYVQIHGNFVDNGIVLDAKYTSFSGALIEEDI